LLLKTKSKAEIQGWMIIWEVARLPRGIDKISMNQDPGCWKGHSAWLSIKHNARPRWLWLFNTYITLGSIEKMKPTLSYTAGDALQKSRHRP
jgi:hypothetical protein